MYLPCTKRLVIYFWCLLVRRHHGHFSADTGRVACFPTALLVTTPD